MSVKACPVKNTLSQRRPCSRQLYYFSFFIMFAGYLFLAYWLLIGQYYKTNHNAYVCGHLIKIFPQHSAHITQFLVKENDFVIKGQPIAFLDKANAYTMLMNAKINLSLAIRYVNNRYQTITQLQSRIQNILKMNEEALTKAQELYRDRLSHYDKKIISADELKQAQILVEKATDSLEEAHAENNFILSLLSDPNIYHNPIVLTAMDQFRSAYLNWQTSVIYAPETGYIAERRILPREIINPHTLLMTMVPLSEIGVNVPIEKENLKNIRKGQTVKLISNIHKNIVYTGTIVDIYAKSNDFPNNISSFYSHFIRIQVDPEQLIKYPIPLGLPMSVTINLRHSEEKLITLKNTLPRIETEDYQEKIASANQLIDKIIQDNTKNLTTSQTQLGSL